MLFKAKRKKVFVIGRGKTGTTSIGKALATLGFRVGDQPTAELMLEDWAKRDFRNIVKYCNSADAFQDVPFSLNFTYQVMDYVFPGSKFILTIRNSSAEWYESLTRFHTKIVEKGRLPTAEDLKAHSYRQTGWLWRTQQLIYGIDEKTLYDRNIYTEHYEAHNEYVVEYFRYRPADLLILNLAQPGTMQRLCDFLGVNPTQEVVMPHLNKSSD
jgi:hypothetical protein